MLIAVGSLRALVLRHKHNRTVHKGISYMAYFPPEKIEYGETNMGFSSEQEVLTRSKALYQRAQER